jgi:hypothetical protein
MFFVKYISFPIFFTSFIIGLIFTYLKQETRTTIYVYPTPDNTDTLLFKDQVDNCYKFSSSEIKCPLMQSSIHKIPIQDAQTL